MKTLRQNQVQNISRTNAAAVKNRRNAHVNSRPCPQKVERLLRFANNVYTISSILIKTI